MRVKGQLVTKMRSGRLTLPGLRPLLGAFVTQQGHPTATTLGGAPWGLLGGGGGVSREVEGHWPWTPQSLVSPQERLGDLLGASPRREA